MNINKLAKKEKKKNILVTGAAGLQGYHLVRDLVKQPEVNHVLGVDNFSRPFLEHPSEWADNLSKKFTLEQRTYQSLKVKELSEFDAVIHLAASISVPESMSSDEMQRSYWQNNATGMVNFMIKLMKTHKEDPKKWPVVVYASTSETFGNPIIYPMPHDHLQNPRSIYAVSKMAAEHTLMAHAAWNNYPGVVVRTFNTYGPNQNSSFSDAAVIALFIKQALKGETLNIHGDGEQTRDFQYAGDAIRAYRRLALGGIDEETGHFKYTGERYNTGTGVMTKIKDLADTIRQLTGSESKIIYTPGRTGDLEALQADYAKIQRDLGWEPEISLSEGLDRTIQWYEKQFAKQDIKSARIEDKVQLLVETSRKDADALTYGKKAADALKYI